MPDNIVNIGDLKEVGHYKPYNEIPFDKVFICRINFEGKLPVGAVAVEGSETECIVAFSRLCTHLGCSVIKTEGSNLSSKEFQFTSVVVCPCHSSNFDLASQGLVVLGPATDCLPQIKLKKFSENEVQLLNWIRDKSVPYGVAYEETY